MREPEVRVARVDRCGGAPRNFSGLEKVLTETIQEVRRAAAARARVEALDEVAKLVDEFSVAYGRCHNIVPACVILERDICDLASASDGSTKEKGA